MPEEFAPVPFVRPGNTEGYFAPGTEAKHKYAVMYQGEYETLWDGTAVAVRGHARALASAGTPVFLKSFSGTVTDEFGAITSVHMGGLSSDVIREVGDLVQTSAEAYFPVIKHAVIRDAEHLKRLVIPRGAIARGGLDEELALRAHIYGSTVIYSVWERDRVDPAIVKILSRVAENWVPCHENRSMLIDSGVPPEKIQVIPHPYDPADDILKLRRRRPDTTWKKFYSIGRWEPRKGYAELIEAFLRAFTPYQNVELMIKYTGGRWPGYPTPEETLQRLSGDPDLAQAGWTPARIRDRVQLKEGRFPRAEILRLHYKNNIYVSSSHGEAWCLPAFEAGLAGNQLVFTMAGGIEDFAGNGHVVVPRSTLEPVPASYGWESDAKWLGYDVAALSRALQLAEAPAAHNIADRLNLSLFTLEAVGARMRERILKISERREEALEYYQGRT